MQIEFYDQRRLNKQKSLALVCKKKSSYDFKFILLDSKWPPWA